MATVLVGFVFAALVEESPTDVERLINFAPKATPSDGYHPKKFGGNKLLLIPCLNDIDTLDDPGIQWFLTLVAVIDQVRMALMVYQFSLSAQGAAALLLRGHAAHQFRKPAVFPGLHRHGDPRV